jgi:hypothetical protein
MKYNLGNFSFVVVCRRFQYATQITSANSPRLQLTNDVLIV